MQRNDLYFIIEFIAGYGLLLSSGSVPEAFRPFTVIGGMLVVVIPMLFQDYVYRLITADYRYLEATVEPNGQKLDIFYKNYKSIEVAPNQFVTLLDIGNKMKINVQIFDSEQYLPITTEVLGFEHHTEWEKRVHLVKGKAYYKDSFIDHGATDGIRVAQFPEGSTRIVDGAVIPTFNLVRGGGDYFLEHSSTTLKNVNELEEKFKNIDENNLKDDDKVSGVESIHIIKSLLSKLTTLQSSYNLKAQEALQAHQDFDRAKELMEGYKNGYLTELKNKTDKSKMAVEWILTMWQEYQDFQKLAKKVSGRKEYFKWKYVPLMIIGAITIAIILKPDSIREIGYWLQNSANQTFLIVISVIAVIGLYYTNKKRK